MAVVAVWLAVFTNRRQIDGPRHSDQIGACDGSCVDHRRPQEGGRREDGRTLDGRQPLGHPPAARPVPDLPGHAAGRRRRLPRRAEIEPHAGGPASPRPSNCGRRAKPGNSRVKCDGAERLAIVERKGWANRGSTGGGEFSSSEQLPPDKPLVLYRRRYMIKDSTGNSQTPPGPTEGLMLWIEPVAGAEALAMIADRGPAQEKAGRITFPSVLLSDRPADGRDVLRPVVEAKRGQDGGVLGCRRLRRVKPPDADALPPATQGRPDIKPSAS